MSILHESDRLLVYGELPAGYIVYLPKRLAEDLSLVKDAIGTSSTWGEFRSRIPDPGYLQPLIIFEGGYLPGDEEPFPGYDHPLVADGDYPLWPAQLMLEWVPRDIVESRFAAIEMSVHNGAFLTLDSGFEHEIEKAFRDHGFEVEKNVLLVRRASGYAVPDPS